MQEEREELKEAAEQTLNVIVEIGLDGRIKWVSPSWRQVVGTPPEAAAGRTMSDILVSDKNAFDDAIEAMRGDDSHSRFIRFAVYAGPDSVLARRRSSQSHRVVEDEEVPGSLGEVQVQREGETTEGVQPVVAAEAGDQRSEQKERGATGEEEEEEEEEEGLEDRGEEGGKGEKEQVSTEASRNGDILNMEAQGIMVYSRSAGKPDHVRVRLIHIYFCFSSGY